MRTFHSKDGRRLAFEDSGGSGPTVLCLAGLTRNSRDFEDVAAFLSPDFRVIRLDSRGRGRSEHAKDPLHEYSIPVEAGDALALLDYLEVEEAAIVGTSRGGILAMALASGNPGRIAAVVLNDVGAVVEGRGLLRILATLGRQPKADSFAELAEELRSANEHEFPHIPLEDWERYAHRLFDSQGGRPVLAYDPHLRTAVAQAIDMGEPSVSLWPLFEALRNIPVLVIHGENSDILSAKTVAEMRLAHDDLKVVELAGRGHAPFLDEIEALRSIKSFLESWAENCSERRFQSTSHSSNPADHV